MASNMARKLMGRKRGMVRMFTKDGSPVACTVLAVEPNVIAQIKTTEVDGYEAVQLGFDEIRTKDPRTVSKRVTKPRLGHFKKANLQAYRELQEVRIDDASQYQAGQTLSVSVFDGVEYVDVMGTSKGKGYQGVIKKYGFSGGPASHGSGFHRHAGSTGMRSTPGRCLPGSPRPSHMGDVRVTVQNLKVFAIDVERGLVIVQGAVPGAKNGLVVISAATKKQNKK